MKKIWCLSLAFLTFLVGIPPFESASASPVHRLPITAGSALLIDASTQRVIYAKAPYTPRPPASTTKIMTAMVVLETMPLDRVVRIPGWVRSVEPSKIYLKPGESYKVRDLLHATLISSANDAAEVLAVAAAGSRANFAELMNRKAGKIGCWKTHFVNSSGLPPVSRNQYSTVYDLALIMNEARRYSFIVDSLSRKYQNIYSLRGRRILLRNHNRLLWKTHSSVIGKTGYTRRGKHCFVGRIHWKGRDVLVSLLGSHKLWKDLKVLVDYQFGAAIYKIHKNRKQWSATATRGIQRALTKAGFSPGKVDGKFGPKTLRAVERFQKQNGLAPNGIVNSSTCKSLSGYGLNPGLCS